MNSLELEIVQTAIREIGKRLENLDGRLRIIENDMEAMRENMVP